MIFLVNQRRKEVEPTKTPPFVWGADQKQVFDTLKEALNTAPIQAYPDFTKAFKLHTDASGASLRAVIYQEIDGKEYAICNSIC